MAALEVLAVASEFFPLVKTGGLADVAGALPAALRPHGIAVTTLLPGYPAVLAGMAGTRLAQDLGPLFGGPARLLAGEAAGAPLLVIDAPHLYARPGNPYLDSMGRDWQDNAARFAALARVGARLARGLLPDWRPALVHGHDWQAGLLPAYLHYETGGEPGRTLPPSVTTIHNLAFQGLFEPGLLAELGLPPAAYAIDALEYHGRISFLKGGIRFADRVTTVSPSYAREIRTPEGGMGLDGLLRARGTAVSGILNGIDTTVWDPRTDPALPQGYSLQDPTARAASKAALCARFDLDPARLLFGVVSRLTTQKGLDLLPDCLPTLREMGAGLIILGSGAADLERAFAEAVRPGETSVMLGYDESLAHLIYAGADALLIPSRFEPCGLTQLCAMRYGCLPVVTRVGGLADTVIDANEAALAAGVATGFQMDAPDQEALDRALRRVGAVWQDRAAWAAMQRSAMAGDVSWNRSARQYAALFRELVPEGAGD